MILQLLSVLLLVSPIVSIDNKHVTGNGYEYWCYGRCDNTTIQSEVRSGVIISGGGTDVDDAFRWLIDRSGNGRIVIIRASGDDAYNKYIYSLGDIYSVTTILFKSRTASFDAGINSMVRNADGLYMAGGDQSLYLSYWKDSDLENSLNWLINTKKITIGGTSAGMAVLPQWIYSAEEESVVSEEALENPYNKDMTFATGFLEIPLLKNVITDTHFFQRNRMGRTITFLARLLQDGNVTGEVRGIACDEATSFLLNSDGTGAVYTQATVAYAYMMRATYLPKVCKQGQPLTFSNVEIQKIGKSEMFNFKTWSALKRDSDYQINVVTGDMSSIGNDGNIY